MINKQVDATDNTNMIILNIGMLNTIIDEETITKIYNSLDNQITNQLNVAVIESQKKQEDSDRIIKDQEKQLHDMTSCKLSPEICGICTGVDTRNLAAIKASSACYTAFSNKCDLVNNDTILGNNPEETELCQFIKPISIETASNCIRDTSHELIDMRTINLDKLSRTEPTASIQNDIEPITLSQLDKPLLNGESASNDESASNSGYGHISDYVKGTTNKDQLYSNILRDYQKDLDNEIKENVDIEQEPNWYLDFMKYFFFIK
jgi:hypothetical protein